MWGCVCELTSSTPARYCSFVTFALSLGGVLEDWERIYDEGASFAVQATLDRSSSPLRPDRYDYTRLSFSQRKCMMGLPKLAAASRWYLQLRADPAHRESGNGGDPPVALRSLSSVPPEILGKIFQHNISLHRIQHGQYYRVFNFLFVCRRWYNVAQATPHLWCKLGNDVGLWPTFARLSKRLDLSIEMLDVLGEFSPPETLAFHAIFRDAAFF